MVYIHYAAGGLTAVVAKTSCEWPSIDRKTKENMPALVSPVGTTKTSNKKRKDCIRVLEAHVPVATGATHQGQRKDSRDVASYLLPDSTYLSTLLSLHFWGLMRSDITALATVSQKDKEGKDKKKWVLTGTRRPPDHVRECAVQVQ